MGGGDTVCTWSPGLEVFLRVREEGAVRDDNSLGQNQSLGDWSEPEPG